MQYYCTLFDVNYLSRGLSMYNSLKEQSDSFHLYILLMDDKSYEILSMLNLEDVTIISLFEFEDEELLRIKKSRTSQEYCWTCTPSVIKYCIEKYKLDLCIYIDADLQFYSNPDVLINEMGTDSVLITEHRYSFRYKSAATSGIYCVQFIAFRNDAKGLRVLNWWKKACDEWCYARFEEGKFGDQKYLDDWPHRFEGIHVLQHLGGGVAPWNIQQYKFSVISGEIYGLEIETKNTFLLVFYHFHGIKFYENGIVYLNNYMLTDSQRKLIYYEYVTNLERIKKEIINVDSSVTPHGINPAWTGRIYNPGIIIGLYFKDVVLCFFRLLKHIFTFSHIRFLMKTHNYFKLEKIK